MSTISFALATRNEQAHIKDCLESIKWADEIVIYDEKSDDQTVALAKKYTSKIFLTDHDPMFHHTKQKAIAKCTSDWVMSIDADERVSPELKEEIRSVMASSQSKDGYKMPRLSRIFGKWIEHTGWYPDYQVKLFKKGKGRYLGQSVHELIEIDGEVGTLKSNLTHEHYSTIDWFLDRRFAYTKDDAENIVRRKETVAWTDALKYPSDEFFKRFFFWEGYKDGFHGLMLSLLMAFDRLIVFARVWEQQKFWQYGGTSFKDEVVNQAARVRSDWYYWLAVTTANPLKKLSHKIKRKVSF